MDLDGVDPGSGLGRDNRAFLTIRQGTVFSYPDRFSSRRRTRPDLGRLEQLKGALINSGFVPADWVGFHQSGVQLQFAVIVQCVALPLFPLGAVEPCSIGKGGDSTCRLQALGFRCHAAAVRVPEEHCRRRAVASASPTFEALCSISSAEKSKETIGSPLVPSRW